MSIAQLETLYEAAIAAMDSADYSTAILKLMAIKARLVTTPNLAKSIGSGGTSSVAFNATSAGEIDSLIRECKQLKAQAASATKGVFQQTKITYARAGLV